MPICRQVCLLISFLFALSNRFTCDAFSPNFINHAVTNDGIFRIQSASSFPKYTHRTQFSVMSVDYNIESSSSASDDDNEDNSNINQPECASLLPGQVVSIRIGDTSLARKAWKKRRRSGSPILVPCTIVGMNRDLMVKNNIINLLHRFGKKYDSSNKKQNNANPNGVHLSVGAIVKLYKHRLGGNLLEHAKALGHKTIVSYLKATFDDNNAKENGIQTIRIGSRNELSLSSPLSVRLARESAHKAQFVQFITDDSPSLSSGDNSDNVEDIEDKEYDHDDDDDLFPELSVDYDDLEDDDEDDNMHNIVNQMIHSGTTFQFANNHDKYQTIAEMDASTIQPLSAALRIAHSDEISSRITAGMQCNAFVHSYEPEGDNGSPLLICAIDPPREQIRDQMKRRAYVRKKMNNRVDSDIEIMKRLDGDESSMCDLKDLKAGDGPFQATVVRVSERAGAAFVDLGVSRQKGKKHGGGKARVLGMLRFEDVKDAGRASCDAAELGSSECTSEEAAIIEASILEGSLEEGEEFEEDVSDMYFIDEDGTVSMLDAESDSPVVIGSIDEEEDDEDDDDDDDDDNMFAGMSPEERLRAIGDLLAKEEEDKQKHIAEKNDINDASSLQVGDEIEVFVRAVSPQSGRFMVTTDTSIKKMKDIKQEKEADKRLERLTAKMGGESGMKMIEDLEGEEIEGEIKAASKAGDWYYVQPLSENNLPVGVANCEIEESFSSGDRVLIKFNGIDYSRGQISLKIVKRL